MALIQFSLCGHKRVCKNENKQKQSPTQPFINSYLWDNDHEPHDVDRGQGNVPFQNCAAHALHCWLWAHFYPQFPLGLSEMGQSGTMQISLGKYLEQSSATFLASSQHWWEFKLHFMVARACSCSSDSCPNQEVDWLRLIIFVMWVRKLKPALLRDLVRVLQTEKGHTVKLLPLLFLAHLSFTPWRALRNI